MLKEGKLKCDICNRAIWGYGRGIIIFLMAGDPPDKRIEDLKVVHRVNCYDRQYMRWRQRGRLNEGDSLEGSISFKRYGAKDVVGDFAELVKEGWKIDGRGVVVLLKKLFDAEDDRKKRDKEVKELE